MLMIIFIADCGGDLGCRDEKEKKEKKRKVNSHFAINLTIEWLYILKPSNNTLILHL